MKKPLPRFRNEDAERNLEYARFYGVHRLETRQQGGSADTKTVVEDDLDSTASMIADLRMLANQRDVPYQSLLKVFLAERIDQERKHKNGSGRS